MSQDSTQFLVMKSPVAKDADLIPDFVSGDTLSRSFAAVKQGGRLVTIASSSESNADPKVKAAFFIVEANQRQLQSSRI